MDTQVGRDCRGHRAHEDRRPGDGCRGLQQVECLEATGEHDHRDRVESAHAEVATLDLVDRIYITIIETVVEGDAFYPEIKLSDYHIISSIIKKADNENPFDHTYYILEK